MILYQGILRGAYGLEFQIDVRDRQTPHQRYMWIVSTKSADETAFMVEISMVPIPDPSRLELRYLLLKDNVEIRDWTDDINRQPAAVIGTAVDLLHKAVYDHQGFLWEPDEENAFNSVTAHIVDATQPLELEQRN